jgi:mono/diheme cytochrome c family protein
MGTFERFPSNKRTLGIIASVVVVGGLCSRLFGQDYDKWPSVWDGVYTPSQASRGEAAYRADCASCHGMKLEGKGQVPPLMGRDFTWDWDFTGVDNLFETMLFTMPPQQRQGQLNAAREAEILAYILKANGFPAGSKELPADAELLRVVRFEADIPSK